MHDLRQWVGRGLVDIHLIGLTQAPPDPTEQRNGPFRKIPQRVMCVAHNGYSDNSNGNCSNSPNTRASSFTRSLGLAEG